MKRDTKPSKQKEPSKKRGGPKDEAITQMSTNEETFVDSLIMIIAQKMNQLILT